MSKLKFTLLEIIQSRLEYLRGIQEYRRRKKHEKKEYNVGDDNMEDEK